MKRGTIIQHFGVEVLVETNDNPGIRMRVSRNSKHVVGDFVSIENSRLVRIKRRNEFVRMGQAGRPQVIGANIDSLAIIVCANPKVPDAFIDQALIVAKKQKIAPFIVVNKSDLDDSQKLYAKIKRNFGDAVPVMLVSAETSKGLSELKAILAQNGRTLFVGVSGAGKSSLTNLLIPKADLKTSKDLQVKDQGKHTTTTSTLWRFPKGGELIDSPGIRDCTPEVLSKKEISQLFFGFDEIMHTTPCRFRDCLHLTEPDCAIRNAVKSGTLSKNRYDIYLTLLQLSTDSKGSL